MILVYDNADYATVRINGGAVDGSTYFTQGNVGIGTMTPQQKLHIRSNAANAFRITRDGMTSEVNLHIANGDYGILGLGGNTALRGSGQNSYFDGNVGIGTTNPGYRLEVKSPGTSDVLSVTSSDNQRLVRVRQNSTGDGEIQIYDHEDDMNVKLKGEGVSFINSANIGIGATSTYPVFNVSSSGTAVYAQTTSGNAAYGHGKYGLSSLGNDVYAGEFYGDVYVSGWIYKHGAGFAIDHPVKPESKTLQHTAVESPENLLIYRGRIRLDNDGKAVVRLPKYFRALADESRASIHLTAVGKPFLSGADWNGDHESFEVVGDPNREVFWEVLADRDDPTVRRKRDSIEEYKTSTSEPCPKGKLLYPKAYGYPESMNAWESSVRRAGGTAEGGSAKAGVTSSGGGA
jgi:hypothetical protein